VFPMRPAPDMQMEVERVSTLASALTALRKGRVPSSCASPICGRARGKRFSKELSALPDPPLLIVTSSLPTSAFGGSPQPGAYDVLAQPFDGSEVARIISMAWLRWKDRHAIRGGVRREMALASGI